MNTSRQSTQKHWLIGLVLAALIAGSGLEVAHVLSGLSTASAATTSSAATSTSTSNTAQYQAPVTRSS